MSTQHVGARSSGGEPPVRRPIDAADPARYVLLGLLYFNGPSHGYVLARAFAPGTALGGVVHLGASHIYALLAQLERDGLISGEVREQGARPPRRVYDIAEAGRATVLRWMDEPVPRPRDVLLDFPLKLYLAQRHDPARALALVRAQRGLFSLQLADLVRDPLQSTPLEDETFEDLVRDGRIKRLRSTLAWLDHCDAVLVARARTP